MARGWLLILGYIYIFIEYAIFEITDILYYVNTWYTELKISKFLNFCSVSFILNTMQTFTWAYNANKIKYWSVIWPCRIKPEIKPRSFSVSLRWAYNFLSQSLPVFIVDRLGSLRYIPFFFLFLLVNQVAWIFSIKFTSLNGGTGGSRRGDC